MEITLIWYFNKNEIDMTKLIKWFNSNSVNWTLVLITLMLLLNSCIVYFWNSREIHIKEYIIQAHFHLSRICYLLSDTFDLIRFQNIRITRGILTRDIKYNLYIYICIYIYIYVYIICSNYCVCMWACVYECV